jgi:hypothetical protein
MFAAPAGSRWFTGVEPNLVATKHSHASGQDNLYRVASVPLIPKFACIVFLNWENSNFKLA